MRNITKNKSDLCQVKLVNRLNVGTKDAQRNDRPRLEQQHEKCFSVKILEYGLRPAFELQARPVGTERNAATDS